MFILYIFYEYDDIFISDTVASCVAIYLRKKFVFFVKDNGLVHIFKILST